MFILEHVYILKNFDRRIYTNKTVEKIYFSDHDALKLVNEKNALDFQTIP